MLIFASSQAGRSSMYSWAEGTTGKYYVSEVRNVPINTKLRWSLGRLCLEDNCVWIGDFPNAGDQTGVCDPNPSIEAAYCMFILNVLAVISTSIKFVISFYRYFGGKYACLSQCCDNGDHKEITCCTLRLPSAVVSVLAFVCCVISTAMFSACKEKINKDVYDLDYGFGFMAAVMGVVAIVPTFLISFLVPAFPPKGSRGAERKAPPPLAPEQTGPSARV